ncbi:hypothetical protein Tco_1546153 [Tanacetum coccineum]
MRVFSLVSLSRFRKASQVKLNTRMRHLSLRFKIYYLTYDNGSLQRKEERQNTFNEMDEYNTLVADVKSRMRRDAVRRVARVPVSLNELEINDHARKGLRGTRDCMLSFMRAHPHRYKHPNMSLDAFREYLAEEVGVVGSDVGMDVVQGAADLLRTRMINLACIPGHVDTLARSHLYPYHLQDKLLEVVGTSLMSFGCCISFLVTRYDETPPAAYTIKSHVPLGFSRDSCRGIFDDLIVSEGIEAGNIV